MKSKLAFWLLLASFLCLQSFRPGTPAKDASAGGEWGNWERTDCYKYLYFRVKNRGASYDNVKYKWAVQFKNRYDEKIYFNYEVSEKSRATRVSNRTDLASGATSDGVRDFYLKKTSHVYVFVERVRFGKDGNQEYYSCDK